MSFIAYLRENEIEKIDNKIRELSISLEAELNRMQRLEIEISPKMMKLEDAIEVLRQERQELMKGSTGE